MRRRRKNPEGFLVRVAASVVASLIVLYIWDRVKAPSPSALPAQPVAPGAAVT